jgi:hypothetical protein
LPHGLRINGEAHAILGLEAIQSRRGSREEGSKQMSGLTTIKRNVSPGVELEKFLLLADPKPMLLPY